MDSIPRGLPRRLQGQTCERCATVFYNPIRRRFCSRACYDARQRQTRICLHCGTTYPANHRGAKFCSAACMRLARSAGDRWRSGVQAWREVIYQRDKVCQDCGASDHLQAHHIRSWADHPAGRLDLANGALLCFTCHRARHGHKVGIGGHGWNGATPACRVCGGPVKRKTASGLCRKCSHRTPRPQRRKPWADNYRKGRTCATCGTPIHNSSATGYCGMHYHPSRHRADRVTPQGG